MIGLDELEAVVGSRFPGGRVRIEPHEHWLACDAVQAAPTSEGPAHPMFGYYVALRGMGMSLDELFAKVGASSDSGVMFGEATLELWRPLAVGGEYGVRGEIVAAERKRGRRAGVFDLVTFRLEVCDDAGPAAVSTNTFVFPRGEAPE